MAQFVLNDLTLGYAGHPAVHHLRGTFATGSITAVLGPNGSGKSTLLKGLAGFLRPMTGTIQLQGSEPHKLAYLPQNHDIDRTFPVTVFDFVATGLWQRRGLLARHGAHDQAQIMQSLRIVGLDGFEARALDTLSGGQFQRCLFARVIVQDAQVILLDEPFAAVDAKTVGDLLTVIKTWQSEGRTVIAVLHEEEIVRQHFPQTLLLAREALAWGPTAEVLTSDNLQRARHIHEAWDEAAPDCERKKHDHVHAH